MRLFSAAVLLFVVGTCTAGLAAQTAFEASIGSGTHYIHGTESYTDCTGSHYLENDSTLQWGPMTSPVPGSWSSDASSSFTNWKELPLIKKDGEWVAVTVTNVGISSIGVGANTTAPGPQTGGSTYVSTLSSDGVVTTIENGAAADLNGWGNPATAVWQSYPFIYSVETINLNTGEYHWYRNLSYSYPGGTCPSYSPSETQDRHAILPVALSAVSLPATSLSIVNPFAYYAGYSSAPAGLDPVISAAAPGASGLAADGQSAALVAFRSDDGDTPVIFALSGSGATSDIGSLGVWDPNYLSNPSPTTGTTLLPAIQKVPDSCDLNGKNCLFVALLWAPSEMPVSSADRSAGTFHSVQITVTATQGITPPLQATINLVPPPLVLIHGVWSSASQAWPPFLSWLAENYPHQHIFTADYGTCGSDTHCSSRSFADPAIQGVLLNTIQQAIAAAANGGMNALRVPVPGGIVARDVDVVAHSMGGLAAQYFVDQGQFPPPLTSTPVHRLIEVGTPHTGSALATALFNYKTALANAPVPIVQGICSIAIKGTCDLANFMAFMNKPVGSAVQALETGLPNSSTSYKGIAGVAQNFTATEGALDLITLGFLPGTQTVQTLLGSDSSHDTIVTTGSQLYGAKETSNINGIVHAAAAGTGTLAPYLGQRLDNLLTDTDETSSQGVWDQALWWLMGQSGPTPRASLRRKTSAQSLTAATTTAQTLPTLDLTGYTQVDASNATFSPTSGTTLTINSAATIAATSAKAITEVLLFQQAVDPTDIPLLYSTQSPFSITFTPTRLGGTDFVAFVVFNDQTYATTALHYDFQPDGNPLGLSLSNVPAMSLAVGSSATVGAQAGYDNGLVDVSQQATYTVRSGNSKVFSVAPGGVITANGPGADWLDVSYNGVSASAQISVGSCAFQLSPTNQIVDVNGASTTVQVSTGAGCAWTATIGDAWLTLSNAGGNGDGTISVNAAANTTGASRTALVTVGTQSVAIIQPATACTYTLDQSQISVPVVGGSGQVNVTTSCPVIASSDSDWLSVTPLSGMVAYTAAPNTGSSQRTASITVGTQTVAVIQAGTVPADFNLSLTPQTLTVTAGQSGKLTLSVNPMGGAFNNAITLACSGLPSTATCAFSTTSVTPGANAATVTVTVNTQSSTSAALFTSRSGGVALFGLAIVFLGAGGNRRRMWTGLRLLALVAVLLLHIGCGRASKTTSNPPIGGTSAGNYTVTITGTSSSGQQHSAPFTLVVQ